MEGKEMSSNEAKEEKPPPVSPCRALNFLHFSDKHAHTKVEFCSDEVEDWNFSSKDDMTTIKEVDWEKPTPLVRTPRPFHMEESTAPTSPLSKEEVETAFVGHPTSSSNVADAVEIKINTYNKKGAYRFDTRSVIPTLDTHTVSAVSLTPAIALDSGIPHVPKLQRTSTTPSTTPSTSTDSVAYSVFQDGEKSGTKDANSLQIKRARSILSPKKRRRNLILCSSLVLFMGIVIIVTWTTISKDSSTVSGPTNVGSDGGGGDVSTSRVVL